VLDFPNEDSGVSELGVERPDIPGLATKEHRLL
jgi:hypothetical protein